MKKRAIKTLYIDPGSPWQNGYIESFHSRFRDECLVREWLLNLRKARVVVEDWRRWYNEERPHSRLGYLSPAAFLKQRGLTAQKPTKPKQNNALSATASFDQASGKSKTVTFSHTTDTHSDTQKLYGTTSLPDDLAEVIAAWSQLTSAMRTEIVAQVRAAQGQ